MAGRCPGLWPFARVRQRMTSSQSGRQGQRQVNANEYLTPPPPFTGVCPAATTPWPGLLLATRHHFGGGGWGWVGGFVWGGGRSRARGAHAHGHTATQVVDGLWTEAHGQQKQSNDPGNNRHNPRYANYWAPLTRQRHIPPHPVQPRHTNYWAPRTRKRHRQEHRPHRPTERSDPTQHAKVRTGDCPGPRKEATTRRNVAQGGTPPPPHAPAPPPKRLRQFFFRAFGQSTLSSGANSFRPKTFIGALGTSTTRAPRGEGTRPPPSSGAARHRRAPPRPAR